MSARERLIELIDKAFLESDDNYGMPISNQVADHLLSNGVIVPPCKVGDTLYTNIRFQNNLMSRKDAPYECTVVSIRINDDYNNSCFGVKFKSGNIFPFTFQDLGRCIFFDKEVAKQLLKERD